MIVSLANFKQFNLLLLKGKSYENEQNVLLTFTRSNTAGQNARLLANFSGKPFCDGNRLGKLPEKELRHYRNQYQQHNYIIKMNINHTI